MTKIRVGVLFGGRSSEHEVSLASADSVINSLDPDKYEAVPIAITREGRWLSGDSAHTLLGSPVNAELPAGDRPIPGASQHGILRMNGREMELNDTAVDVVFPVLHGTAGEDGTVQGLLEIANIPYVGSGVLGSALSMDKIAMKAQLEHAGLPSVRYCIISRREWTADQDATLSRVEDQISYPIFPKPANSGSSLGISKARNREELRQGLDSAAGYDRRIIVEESVDGRELECGVLGNDEPIISVAGEVITRREFYDYEAKYSDDLADLVIPAQLSPAEATEIRDYARRAFVAVDAAGLARVDFFIRRSDGKVLVNEINTMPGFTPTSMYPKLWEASGIGYREIVDRLIVLALERFAVQQNRSIAGKGDVGSSLFHVR